MCDFWACWWVATGWGSYSNPCKCYGAQSIRVAAPLQELVGHVVNLCFPIIVLASEIPGILTDTPLLTHVRAGPGNLYIANYVLCILVTSALLWSHTGPCPLLFFSSRKYASGISHCYLCVIFLTPNKGGTRWANTVNRLAIRPYW